MKYPTHHAEEPSLRSNNNNNNTESTNVQGLFNERNSPTIYLNMQYTNYVARCFVYPFQGEENLNVVTHTVRTLKLSTAYF
jgi:hypothetical protein